MSVRNSLVLDHFFIALDENEFNPLLELKDRLRQVAHSKVAVSDDSWEGMYLYSRTRAYFEILKERRPGALGLCFSPFNPMSVDSSRIVEEIPEEKWVVGNRTFEDGTKWFDWISTGNLNDRENVFFNAWIMRYFEMHRPPKAVPKPPSIDKFRSLRMSLGKSHETEILALSTWFPGEREVTDRRMTFKFVDRDFFPFTVEIDFRDDSDRFQFEGLTFDHCHPDAFKTGVDLQLGAHRLFESHGKVTLSRVR